MMSRPPRALPRRHRSPLRAGAAASALLASLLSASCDGGEVDLPLVINEVHATPPEWVEIQNLADHGLALTGVTLAGSDEAGEPVAVRDPLPNIELRPGERFIVKLGATVADGEVHSARECAIEDVSECGFATTRVRATEGETIYLFARGGGVVDLFVYPPNGAGLDETQCRVPDGTGPETRCVATPTLTNRAAE